MEQNSGAKYPWRKCPSISGDRAVQLQARLLTPVDILGGSYPFMNFRLTRADVEWLLTHHGSDQGPVHWADPLQRQRTGLDLRGAILSGEDLSGLPLAGLLGGLTTQERAIVAKDPRNLQLRDAASVHMEGANLADTHLEGAILRAAHLEGACLLRARLEDALLVGTHLEGCDCRSAHFERANLINAYLGGYSLAANEKAPSVMRWIADYSDDVGQVRQVDFPRSLEATSFRRAQFDVGTNFIPNNIGNQQFGYISLADASLNGMNISRVDWSQVTELGDERVARRKVNPWGKPRSLKAQIAVYKRAARTYSQLALAMSAQGMADQTTQFMYRALILQRKAMGIQIRSGRFRSIVPYLLSWLLFLITGYGYRMWRLLLTYVTLVMGFAVGYDIAGQYCSAALTTSPFAINASCRPGMSWIDPVLISITAFHGRVFSQTFAVGSPPTVLAAIEAIVGLVVEAIFIAMLTQRVFNR